MVKSKNNLIIIIVMLAVGLLSGYWLRGETPIDSQSNALAKTASADRDDGESAANLYVCPMMCVPPQEKPGNCPICGMELIETPAGDKTDLPRLALAPETVKLARIQTAPVERRFVSAEVRLFGQIEYDPAHISYASAYVPGVIDRIYVRRAGQTVRWGDPLFDIHSPEIMMIENQMVDALKFVPGYYDLNRNKPHVRKRTEVLLGRPGVITNPNPDQKKALETINALRLKLTLIGMEKKDIDELMKKGEPSGIATIYAQRAGVVIEQKAFEGTYVNTGTQVFAIANPKYIWVRLKAYESDYSWIRLGQTAEFVTDTFPGETFKGKVAFIDPIFDTQSRTFDVGVIFPDSGGRFRPSMYVRAVISARLTAEGKVAGETETPRRAPLVIPDTAPLITGKRAVVYVAVSGKEGVFEGREIILGPRAKNYYIVRDGLKPGEQVVVNGNFKIDSQIQIMTKPSMMTIQGGHRADEYQQPGGSTVMEAEYRRRTFKRSTANTVETEETAPHRRFPAGMSGKPGHQHP